MTGKLDYYHVKETMGLIKVFLDTCILLAWPVLSNCKIRGIRYDYWFKTVDHKNFEVNFIKEITMGG